MMYSNEYSCLYLPKYEQISDLNYSDQGHDKAFTED